MTWTIAPIVEGHGDVQAVPVLLRLLAPTVRVASPVRFPKTKLLIESELRRAVSIARSNISDPARGLVLLILDCDEDCPASLGPRLLQVMHSVASPASCFVVVVKREFESWIVGGHPLLDESNPEAAGMPKNLIATINGGQYKETVDQARFAAAIEPQRLFTRSQSFRRLFDRLRQIPDATASHL